MFLGKFTDFPPIRLHRKNLSHRLRKRINILGHCYCGIRHMLKNLTTRNNPTRTDNWRSTAERLNDPQSKCFLMRGENRRTGLVIQLY